MTESPANVEAGAALRGPQAPADGSPEAGAPRGVLILGTLLVLALVAALSDRPGPAESAGLQSSSLQSPSPQSSSSAARDDGAPSPTPNVATSTAAMVAAIERLAGPRGPSCLHFQHTQSVAFAFVERRAGRLVIRVSAYPLDLESHARLAAVFDGKGATIEPYREPIREAIFYELELDEGPRAVVQTLDRIFREVFELDEGYELFIEPLGG